MSAGAYLWRYSYFEMHQLPWFKTKWKKDEEDFSLPATLYMKNVLLNKSDPSFLVDYPRNSGN